MGKGSTGTGTTATGPLGSITLAEALRDGAQRQMLIDPLIARGETSLLHSQPRDGKTWFALAAGLAVATGAKFADRWETTQGNVLYCSNEDNERSIAQRAQMLLRGLNSKTLPDGFRLFVNRGLWVDETDWQRRLIAEVKVLEIALVIFDPLRSVTACVDKGPSDLQPLSRFERTLISETGCAIWNLHHETKPSAMSLPDDRRPAQRASGGGLFSTMDAPISIERVDDTKSRFVPDGFKHSVSPDPFIVERLVQDDLAVIVVSDTDRQQNGADLALVDAVREFLRNHPSSSQSDVQRAVRKMKSRVTEALDALKDANEAEYLWRGRTKVWRLK